MEQCSRCVDESKRRFGYIIRHIPKTGRAAKNKLCTKCDRQVHGAMSVADWSEVGKWCRARIRALVKMISG